MIPTIAFIGAGPTTIYTLHALLAAARTSLRILIFEEQDVAGRGTPYRPGWNDPAMLSNIASIEIPPLESSLVDWLREQTAERLRDWEIDPATIDERAFYPRLALGAFLGDQFEAIVRKARAAGIEIDVRTRTCVVDIIPENQSFRLSVQAKGRDLPGEPCDWLVVATGHQWPSEPEVRPGYFLSPWPATVLDRISACPVGIRGTSLTAIDAAVVLALRFGEFVEEGERLRYVPAIGTEPFRLTLMSRKGLLPEADFFHPVPYEPLSLFTEEAMSELIDQGPAQLLDHAFDLFEQQLAAIDPDYADRIALGYVGLEGFRDAYFADRAETDPFVWAAQNLAEAQANHESETVVPWRYAILRMHEIIAAIVPYLDAYDFERFNRLLKPVFVDDYATVPHESIRRMLALHGAGKLELIALGERHTIDSHSRQDGAVVRYAGKEQHFPVFIEATGQHPLGVEDFPFPTLRQAGVVQTVGAGSADSERGIAVDDCFHPLSQSGPADRLYCIGLPFILGRHPFVQGITSSHELGDIVGRDLAQAIANLCDGSIEADR